MGAAVDQAHGLHACLLYHILCSACQMVVLRISLALECSLASASDSQCKSHLCPECSTILCAHFSPQWLPRSQHIFSSYSAYHTVYSHEPDAWLCIPFSSCKCIRMIDDMLCGATVYTALLKVDKYLTTLLLGPWHCTAALINANNMTPSAAYNTV